jgi:hypothetical protein
LLGGNGAEEFPSVILETTVVSGDNGVWTAVAAGSDALEGVARRDD